MGNCCKKYCTSSSYDKNDRVGVGRYEAHPHIAVCGLDGVGKTTLVYRTVLPAWTDAAARMEPTRGFHYEEIIRNGIKIGIWDLPGNHAMRNVWQCFYRYVKMWAVVFVVSLLDTVPERIIEARERLRVLTGEDTLRDSCFCIIMNSFDVKSGSTPLPPEVLVARLGVNEMSNDLKERLRYFVVNIKEGERDEQWIKALHFMLHHFQKIKAGQVIV